MGISQAEFWRGISQTKAQMGISQAEDQPSGVWEKNKSNESSDGHQPSGSKTVTDGHQPSGVWEKNKANESSDGHQPSGSERGAFGGRAL